MAGRKAKKRSCTDPGEAACRKPNLEIVGMEDMVGSGWIK